MDAYLKMTLEHLKHKTTINQQIFITQTDQGNSKTSSRVKIIRNDNMIPHRRTTAKTLDRTTACRFKKEAKQNFK